MQTFEQFFSKPAPLLDSEAQSRLWDSALKDAWDPHHRVTEDATRKYRVKVDKNGDANYFKDERGEWESTDGKLWSRKGSQGIDKFNGSITVSKDGNITVTNGDTGVTTVCLKNGTNIKSFTTADGVKHSLTKDSNGTQISNKIGDQEWLSKDGVTWTNSDGQKWIGNFSIDRFGRYTEQKLGQELTVEAYSGPLKKILDRQTAVEKEWGVKIVQAGDKIRKNEKDYTCRPPTEAELKTLETILSRNRQMNVKNLTVAFVQAGKNTDGGSLWGTYQRQGDKGQIVIMPKHAETNGWQGLEGTMEHELVHHEQYENWGSKHWGAIGAPAFTRELNAKMGWRYDTEQSRYAISDKDGNEWIREDGAWMPLIDGKPNPKRWINSDRMQDLAKVRPSTNYFTNPGEMHAEGISMYRMDRATLLKQSWQLYDICKTWDQQLIDSKFGITDGKPNLIRDEKGVLVPATRENTEAIQKSEEQWRRDLTRPQKIGDKYFAGDKTPGHYGDSDRQAHCEHCTRLDIRKQYTR